MKCLRVVVLLRIISLAISTSTDIQTEEASRAPLNIQNDILAFLANGENATEYFCNAAIITNYLVAAAATCFVARDKKKGALYVQYGQINGRFRNQKKVVEAYEENESILSNSIHLVLLVMEEKFELDRELYIQTWSKSNKISFEEKAEIYGYSPMNLRASSYDVTLTLRDNKFSSHCFFRVNGYRPLSNDVININGGPVFSQSKLIAICDFVCDGHNVRCRKMFSFQNSVKKILDVHVFSSTKKKNPQSMR